MAKRGRDLNRKIPAAISVVVVLLIAGVLWKREQVRRWKWEAIAMPDRFARVPEDWSVRTLAKRLKENKKIRDANTFINAAAQVKLKTVSAGGYRLPPKVGPLELAQLFARGPSHRKVTFPEGWTAWQMSTRLQEKGFKSAAQLRALVYPPGENISSLEGTLFPDTYWLPLQATAPQLIQRLRARTGEITKTLPQPFPAGYEGRPLSLKEVVILASLVERETGIASERPLVAGVLLKRLRDNMRLQCDASVQYALQIAAWERGETEHQTVLRRDYKFPSPYNTYLNYGLPPAAICNPGQASLKAAAHPLATEYLYYVWSPQLKRHRFAKTFSGHKHNIALARAEEAES